MRYLSDLMQQPARKVFAVLALVIFSSTVQGEDLSGADNVICAPARIEICANDGSCVSALPWEVNVPQFILVDFEEELLSTTEASERPRATEIDSLKREDGVAYLQGVENGRAYSIVINETTGFMTVAVARDYLTVTGSGVCTPAD